MLSRTTYANLASPLIIPHVYKGRNMPVNNKRNSQMQNIFTIQFPEGGGNSKCQTAHGNGWWETAVEHRDPGGWFWERTQPSGSDLKLTRNMFTEKQLVLRNSKLDRKLRRGYVDWFWLCSPIFTGWISSSTSKALYCGMWLLLFLPMSPMWTSGDISLNRRDVVLRQTPKHVLCWLKLFVWRPWGVFFTRQVTCLHRQHGWYRTKISPPSSRVAAFKRSCTMHKGAELCHMLQFKARLNLIKATDNGSLHHTGQNDFS